MMMMDESKMVFLLHAAAGRLLAYRCFTKKLTGMRNLFAKVDLGEDSSFITTGGDAATA